MFSTADSYEELSRRLAGVLKKQGRAFLPLLGYASADIASRCIQRFAELSVFKFTRAQSINLRETGRLLGEGTRVDCEGLEIVGSERIKVRPKFFARMAAEFVGHWVHAFIAILFSLRVFGTCKRLCLLHGVGADDLQAGGSDRRFLDFCERGPLSPLTDCDMLIVQSTRKINSISRGKVKYGRAPLLIGVATLGLGPIAWGVALLRHFYSACVFLIALSKCPVLILIGRDIAYHATAKSINDGRLADVILTSSNYFSQALWMWALPGRRYKTHLAWYSQNSYPLAYRCGSSHAAIPNLSYIKADIQWVWTKRFQSFLETVGCQSDFKIVAPIVWHLPSASFQSSSTELKISIFDVTPIEVNAESHLGLVRNYYSVKNAKQFIQSVVSSARRVSAKHAQPIRLILKHKRNHTTIHADEYINLIAELEMSGELHLVPSTTNLYDLIAQSDLVLSMPFSSPAYIGAALGRMSAWYDATGELCEPEEFLPFITSECELDNLIEVQLKVKASSFLDQNRGLE